MTAEGDGVYKDRPQVADAIPCQRRHRRVLMRDHGSAETAAESFMPEWVHRFYKSPKGLAIASRIAWDGGRINI